MYRLSRIILTGSEKDIPGKPGKSDMEGRGDSAHYYPFIVIQTHSPLVITDHLRKEIIICISFVWIWKAF